MPDRPVRFVHTSDLHLEQPPYGLAEVPDHLRALLIDAATGAATRVFDAVCDEGADFLVLSGDVLQPVETGPAGLAFLLEQFQRLAEHNIEVYWAGGQVDAPECWPARIPLPENVHVFPAGHVEQIIHHRDGHPVATVLGTSRHERGRVPVAKFRPDEDDLPSVAVSHGRVDAAALEKQKVDYLALGSQHNRRTLTGGPTMAHYPGSPQGRFPGEPAAHGCTVVEVDETGKFRSRMVPTDVLRWCDERIVIERGTTRDQLEHRLHERLHALRSQNGQWDLIVSWTITGTGDLLAQLRNGPLADELLMLLRQEHGYGPPAAWSASLVAEPCLQLPHRWYEQETILGDFLRLVRQYQQDEELPLDLDPYLSDRHAAGQLGATVVLDEPEKRKRVLSKAAALGAELLGAEQPAEENSRENDS